ncbi:MAG: RidA family protein [Solirubrobacteraceae bacterium]
MKKLISSGSEFEEKIGYSRAVCINNMVYMSGTTGYDYENMTISDDVTEQTKQAIENIKAALAKADATLEDIVKIVYVYPNPADFELCFPVLGSYFGKIKPAITMISSKLMDEKMKVEIEVTAVKQ